MKKRKTNVYTSPRWAFWLIIGMALLLIFVTCVGFATVAGMREFIEEWRDNWNEFFSGVRDAIRWHRGGRLSANDDEVCA